MRAIPLLMAFVVACVLSGCASTNKDWHVGTDREVSTGAIMIETSRTDPLDHRRDRTVRLVWMGNAGGSGVIEHREFAGGSAWPPERYNVTVGPGGRMTIKDIELEIVSITDGKLRFRVLREDIQMRKDYDTPAPAKTGGS